MKNSENHRTVGCIRRRIIHHEAMTGRRILLLGALWCPAVLAVDFMNDVKPLLSRLGCNGSSCHGAGRGSERSKPSVFGADPRGTVIPSSRKRRGRRITQAAPEASCFCAKPPAKWGTARCAPATGLREYRVLHDWIRGGLTFAEQERPAMVALRMSRPGPYCRSEPSNRSR